MQISGIDVCVAGEFDEADGGVYVIIHEPTHRAYVGTTHCFRERFRAHISSLTLGYHHCHALQADWLTDGPSAFTFVILDVIHDKSCRYSAESATISRCLQLGYPLYNDQVGGHKIRRSR